MSYTALGQSDPLSCMAQQGIPTQDGRCVLTTGKSIDQVQCEVAGGSWDGGCTMPGGAAPPVQTTGIAAAAQAVCQGLGGQYDIATGNCLVGTDVIAQRQLVEMAQGSPPPPPPEKKSVVPAVAGVAIVVGIGWLLFRSP